jgi:hypothetical protein
MELFALALILGMGSEINKAHNNIEMLNEQIQIMNELDEKRTEDYIKQQEAINDLLIEVEQLGYQVSKTEEKYEQDFLNLAGKHSSSYARHETMLSKHEHNLKVLNIRTDSILEQLRIMRGE